MFNLEVRIERLEQRMQSAERRLGDALARIKRLEDRMASIGGGGGFGGGGAAGAYYADFLTIPAHSTDNVEVFQTWDDASVGVQLVRNKFPDACTATKRQLMDKNPDDSFTVVSESCTDQ